jgi:predicted TIM-barrel fold metal-dependent hydrolase
VDLPKIISVDDHVVEPPHVWQTWLPEKYRERGPRVERKRWGAFEHMAGARYEMHEDPEGLWGDAWYYEDRLIYVHKRFVAIPQAATTEDDQGRIDFDRTQMQMTAVTYDEMRPGCYDRDERVKDLARNWVDGSLPFPTFPRFCGQTFYEGEDKELGLACVRAYNDWMVEEWCAPSGGMNIPLCLIPLWDVELAAEETQRNADRGVRAICFSELPHHLELPTIHSGYWDPLFQVCNDTGVTVCMHIGSSSTNPAASPDAPKGVGGMLAFNNSMASLGDWLFSTKLITFPNLKLAYSEGQIGWIPYALERADTVWEHHDSWQHSKDLIPEPPSTYYYGRVFGCFTADRHGLRSLEEVGPDNICFETDYPHTDTTWPDSKAYAEKMLAGLDDEVAHKVLRGNAIRMLELDRT